VLAYEINGSFLSSVEANPEKLGDEKKFKLNALFLGGNARQLHKQGKVEYTPGYLRDAAVGIHNRDPEYKYDIVAVRVSPPDENGYHSLGPNHDMIMTLIERQPNVKIIAEINPNVPRTRGTNKIKGHRFFASYHSDSQLAGPVVVPYTPVEKAIGEYVAELIPNDANLQIGIGNLFNGLPDAIKAKGTQRIKMYSEMISDSAMNMVENGNVERIKTGFAFGSTDFYKWLDGNQKVEFASTLEVNDIAKISKKNRMHAVNTALQVNLKGDVNATMGPNNARISSPGGQAEFMQGAKLSKQGKSIIAIRSTAKMGEISTIALNLYGDSITTPHENVSHVVTEYGIAVLKNKSERERALALIKISHPKFRKELAEDAYLSDIITEQDLTTIRYNDKEIPLEIVDEAIEEAAEEAPKA
ncbi:MAG: acetyl-CoA hydrolase/transferase family protein, partial [Bacteriovoracaceae bacterium]